MAAIRPPLLSKHALHACAAANKHQPLSCCTQAGQAYPQPPYAHQQQSYLADGYPALQHATQPPVQYAPPLVVNSELVVLEPLRGSHVVLACPHCGHTGPAAVSKVGAGLPGLQDALHGLMLHNRDARIRRIYNVCVVHVCRSPAS